MTFLLFRCIVKIQKGVARQNDGQLPNYGLQRITATFQPASLWAVIFLCFFSLVLFIISLSLGNILANCIKQLGNSAEHDNQFENFRNTHLYLLPEKPLHFSGEAANRHPSGQHLDYIIANICSIVNAFRRKNLI